MPKMLDKSSTPSDTFATGGAEVKVFLFWLDEVTGDKSLQERVPLYSNLRRRRRELLAGSCGISLCSWRRSDWIQYSREYWIELCGCNLPIAELILFSLPEERGRRIETEEGMFQVFLTVMQARIWRKQAVARPKPWSWEQYRGGLLKWIGGGGGYLLLTFLVHLKDSIAVYTGLTKPIMRPYMCVEKEGLDFCDIDSN